jgi:hypothetical protein
MINCDRIFYIFLFFCIFSCNNEKIKLRKDLSEFRQRKVKIEYPLKKFSTKNGWNYFMPKSKYQMVTYIDGTCPICLNELGLWNEYISNHQGEIDYLLFVKTNNIDDLKYFLLQIDYNYDVIPDSTDTFFRKTIFPPNEDFHTFLTDSLKNVLIVGNPLKNKTLDKLIWKTINKSNPQN